MNERHERRQESNEDETAYHCILFVCMRVMCVPTCAMGKY
jgi:hypothetical protein